MNTPRLGDITMMRLRLFRTGIVEKALDAAKDEGLQDPDMPDETADMEKINTADDPADLIDLCRKVKSYRGGDVLVEKILADQKNTMPILIEKFSRSLYDHFIDKAVLILAYCEEVYVDEVLKNYKNIRSDYAKCGFCVVLGYRNRKDCIDFLKQEVKNLGRDEKYKTGPEVALEELM